MRRRSFLSFAGCRWNLELSCKLLGFLFFFSVPMKIMGFYTRLRNVLDCDSLLRSQKKTNDWGEKSHSISNVGLVQSHFWRNAGFDVIHDIKQLDSYTARFDPTVIPITDASAPKQSLPAPTERKGNGTAYYTSADYHARYLSGELTPTAVVEALLPLIRRDVSPPGKHSVAFLESHVESVRAAAEASTQRYKNGKPLGPLDGVPVAVKDEVHVKGYARTLGSKIDMKGDIDETSWCVKKWEEAGAIMIGKTTMHEFGLGASSFCLKSQLNCGIIAVELCRVIPLPYFATSIKVSPTTANTSRRHDQQQSNLWHTKESSSFTILLRRLLRWLWLCGRSRPRPNCIGR